MIELTEDRGRSIFINPKHIVSIAEHHRTINGKQVLGSGQINARIYMLDQSHFDVQEDVGTVVAKTL